MDEKISSTGDFSRLSYWRCKHFASISLRAIGMPAFVSQLTMHVTLLYDDIIIQESDHFVTLDNRKHTSESQCANIIKAKEMIVTR